MYLHESFTGGFILGAGLETKSSIYKKALKYFCSEGKKYGFRLAFIKMIVIILGELITFRQKEEMGTLRSGG